MEGGKDGVREGRKEGWREHGNESKAGLDIFLRLVLRLQTLQNH